MAIIAQEGQFSRTSSLVKRLAHPDKVELHYEVVTANEAADTVLTLGTVLGKVTATGKYKVAKATAADGSQVPAAVVLTDGFGATKAATAKAGVDTKFVALARGLAVVAKEGLKLDASFDTAAKLATAYDALKAIGILAEASA